VDLYRVSSAQEAVGIGLNDYLDDRSAITLIEWPEHIQELLPAERLWILIRLVEGNKRLILFSAHGARYEALLRIFRKEAFGI
jgi:tRNA threonylcarbamoyladenosine biosynthesis protein TsaE